MVTEGNCRAKRCHCGEHSGDCQFHFNEHDNVQVIPDACDVEFVGADIIAKLSA